MTNTNTNTNRNSNNNQNGNDFGLALQVLFNQTSTGQDLWKALAMADKIVKKDNKK